MRAYLKPASGFVAALGILVVMAGFARHSSNEALRSADTRAQSRRKLQVFETLISHLKDAETGQRGYLLTGKESYLEPFVRARVIYQQDLDEMLRLVQGDPAQQRQVELLRTLAMRKIDELALTVRLRQSEGLAAALRVVNTDEGFALMNQMRAVNEAMRNSEEIALGDITQRAHAARWWADIVIPVGLALEILVVAAAAFLSLREMKRRQKMQDELRQLNSSLELKIDAATQALRRTLADLEGKSELLETVLEQMPAAVIVADATGRLVLSNSQMLQVWRHPLIMSGSVDEYAAWKGFHSDGRPYEGRDWPLARALLSGALIKNEDTVVERGDGTRGVLRLTAAPICRGGKITAAIVICEDVTDRKQVEVAESRERAALEASRLKSEFLANMSHEIRTPMNAIVGMAELLAETSLDDEQRRFVDTSRRAADNLLGLLNDILDISKIEAGDLKIDSIPFDLREMVESVTELMAHRAHSKGLELGVLLKHDVATARVGDPSRIRQVLVNLIGNAIKFTARGEVVVRIERDPASTTALRFTVSDTGIGIPADQVAKLFDRFTQLDSSITRKYGGTGLGLSISKQLVDMMGGRIWAESAVGAGSQFSFVLELTPQADRIFAPEAGEEMNLRGVRALIVDDNATNRMILTEALRGWGARTDEADSGEAAIEKMRESRRAADPYRFLLLDYRMPGMDGLDVASVVRNELAFADISMMMLTSDNRGGMAERCRELGIGNYLIKPIKRAELRNALLRARESAQVTVLPPPASPSTESVTGALRILLVDDSDDNRLLVQAYLRHSNHRIETAENGEIALAKFVAGEFDLVLMDMQMPVMDGYTATRRIRAWEAEQGRARSRIVALTAFALKEEAQKSYDAGCDLHLTKPIKKAILLECIAESSKKAA